MVKPKFDEKEKLCYMDTERFIVSVKIDKNYKDIAKDVKTRFGTSNYELEIRPLLGWKNMVIGLVKDKLGEKIMTNFL